MVLGVWWGWGEGMSGAWGVDGGCMPLPSHLERYCDPASVQVIRTLCLPKGPLKYAILEAILKGPFNFSHFSFTSKGPPSRDHQGYIFYGPSRDPQGTLKDPPRENLPDMNCATKRML